MPTITMQDGAKITLPDGATDEQIQEAAEDYAASLNAAPDGAASSLTQEQLDRIAPIQQAQPSTNPYTGQSLGVQPIQQKSVDANNEKSNAIRSNPSILDKIAKADKQGWIEGILRGADNTINEFSTGIEDLADKHLPSAISNVLAYRPFGENGLTPEQRIARRKTEMEANNEDQVARTLANPAATTIGSMLPYFGTGRIAELGIDAVANAVSPITKQLVQKSIGTVGRLEGNAGGSIGELGRKANLELSRMKQKPYFTNDFRERFKYGMKMPVIGAAEGSLNYNQTAGEGALYSTLGILPGTVGPLRMFNRVENVSDANRRAIIDEMHGKGFALTPGVRTANRQMQIEEAGMKNSDVLGDFYHQNIARVNQRKVTEMAGDAMGLNGKNRDTWSQAELSAHLDDLSKQYKNLEANTTGKLTPVHMKATADLLDDLKPVNGPTGPRRNTSAEAKAVYNRVKSFADEIRSESTAGPGVSGIQNRTFTGSQYQKWRSKIQNATTEAYQSGNRELGDALSKLRQNLDSALESGMNKKTAAEWKDLNERYAMTNLVMNKGMNSTGKVDADMIENAMMAEGEAIRTLTGKGGRIKNLQDIARYNNILKDVEGGSLTGLGTADYAADRSLGKLPFAYHLKPYARAVASYRLGQTPWFVPKPHHGLGTTAALRMGRAFAQTEPVDKAYEGAKMGVEELLKMIRGE